MEKCNTQENDMATTTTNWRTTGASDPGRYNTPPLTRISSRDLRTETEGKRDEVKQERKRRSKESRAFEKKRGTTRMTRIESSRNQIDYETTPVRRRLETNKTEGFRQHSD